MTDKQEFEEIFRLYYGTMFRMAKRMLGDEAESKDVVSDVFAHLLNSNIALHSETLRSFLLTSVRNRCINLLVHKQKEQAVFVDLMSCITYRGICYIPSCIGGSCWERPYDCVQCF